MYVTESELTKSTKWTVSRCGGNSIGGGGGEAAYVCLLFLVFEGFWALAALFCITN